MKKLVIVGGSRGLGFAIVKRLSKEYNEIVILDIVDPLENFENVTFIKFDLFKEDVKKLNDLVLSCSTLIITAGIGQIKPFEDHSLVEIEKVFRVNAVSTTKLLNLFFPSLLSNHDKKCLIISSIAGEISSPLFSVYGSSKAAVSKLCESLNAELIKKNSNNRITCIAATSFSGTSFYGGETNVAEVDSIARECIDAMNNKEQSHFINSELCNNIISNYQKDRSGFALSSYDYKMASGRVSSGKKYIVGYLSGTFDLFHIGHLNLLKRAKEECDYLVVGVHESGSWKGKETFIPFEERLEIVRNIKYVDEACKSFKEDSDAWETYHYDKLFVGSDYKGSERFNRYEKYFKDKNVKIVYFPYTQGTSSTQLRDKISKK